MICTAVFTLQISTITDFNNISGLAEFFKSLSNFDNLSIIFIVLFFFSSSFSFINIAKNFSFKLETSCLKSFPFIIISSIFFKISITFKLYVSSTILFNISSSIAPIIFLTSSNFSSSSISDIHLSNILIPSLKAPSASFETYSHTPSSYFIFSLSHIYLSLLAIFSSDSLSKSNLKHLDKIVTGILCFSVVASINITFSGGSSNVLSKALNALVVSICASSIIYTLYLTSTVAYITSCLICLIFSTLLFEAASISTTSVVLPSIIFLHTSHSLQGSPSFGFKQFIALAKILAADVFPVPLVPLKIYACDILPDFI